MATTPVVIDYAAANKAANEAEAARRAGKAPEPAPVPGKPAEAAPKTEDDDDKPLEGDQAEDHPGMSRRDRRRMNQLIKDAAMARGRAEAYEQFLKNGKVGEAPKEESVKAEVEPKREDFKTDAEYAAAVARFAAKQETKSATAQADAVKAMQADLDVANEAYKEQVKLIPDWDKVFAKVKDVQLSENAQTLLATSEFSAFIIEYFANNPDAVKTFEELNSNIVKQRAFFHRIEGRVETIYNDRKAKAEEAAKGKKDDKVDDKKEKPSQAERDLKKAAPSESITPKGGTQTNGDIPMMMEDGKTLNPAWKAARNAATGVRP